MIIPQTPLRMSFLGGGTDMEDYFRENGGTRVLYYAAEEYVASAE